MDDEEDEEDALPKETLISSGDKLKVETSTKKLTRGKMPETDFFSESHLRKDQSLKFVYKSHLHW